MKFDPNIHHRRSIRLKEYDYSQPGAYFVTLVTKDRTNLFGEITGGVMRLNILGKLARSTWLRLPDFFRIRQDEWVIMPNHLHAIIWILDSGTGEASAIIRHGSPKCLLADASPQHRPIGTQSGSMGAIIQNFKSISTRNINQRIKNCRTVEARATLSHEIPKSASANASPQQVWQRNYYERVVRNQTELDRIRQYIADNPCQRAEDQENLEYRG